ncbi:hypothetical protein F4703DRAFT_1796481 [Phycomyces blakesleeanus]
MKIYFLFIGLLLGFETVFAIYNNREEFLDIDKSYIPLRYAYDDVIQPADMNTLSRIPLDENTTAVFRFTQRGESVTYNLYLEGYHAKSLCISWIVGVSYVDSSDPAKCLYKPTSKCMDSVESGKCVYGTKDLGDCHSGDGIEGTAVHKSTNATSMLVKSGNSTLLSLIDDYDSSISKRSIMVNYFFYGQKAPKRACGVLLLGAVKEETYTPLNSGIRAAPVYITDVAFLLAYLILLC